MTVRCHSLFFKKLLFLKPLNKTVCWKITGLGYSVLRAEQGTNSVIKVLGVVSLPFVI